MDFHEIDTKGKLWIQRVSSLPSFDSANDVGRILYVTSTDRFYFGTATSWSVWGSDIIPAGTKMVFYQNTAPDGWTIDATVADALIGIKGGSNAFNVNGGQLAGTWVQTNHNHTFSDSFSVSHSHATRDHTLTISEMPRHRHGISDSSCEAGGGDREAGTGNDDYSTYEGGSQPHNHGSTFSATVADTISGTTGDSATASTWRPYAAISIVAEKD